MDKELRKGKSSRIQKTGNSEVEKKITSIYLENISQKAARLGLHRRTLYAWRKKPSSANLDIIERDVRNLLTLIEEVRRGAEG